MVGVVMFVPALIAAELLIFPAVNDFVTTFKTSRLSFLLTFPVIHTQKYYTTNIQKQTGPNKKQNQFFSFSDENNFFF